MVHDVKPFFAKSIYSNCIFQHKHQAKFLFINRSQKYRIKINISEKCAVCIQVIHTFDGMSQNKHQPTLFCSFSCITETTNSRRSCQTKFAGRRRVTYATLDFQWGSCCSIFSFVCSVSQILICSFVVFYVLLQFTASDYTFGIFKLFLWQQYARRQSISLCIT